MTHDTQIEFDRLAKAKHGTFRKELDEERVLIAHCQSYTENSLTHTRWFATVYKNDTREKRNTFNSFLTYDELIAWAISPFRKPNDSKESYS